MSSGHGGNRTLPASATFYMSAIQSQMGHLFVQKCFFQVAWLLIRQPDGRVSDFCALEFRSGLNAALIWRTDHGSWDIGGWVALSSVDGGIGIDVSIDGWRYLQETTSIYSLKAAIDYLASRLPIVPS